MNTCLLLIDIQNDYFPEGKMELINMKEAATNAKLLLNVFRQLQFPVIHVQHFSTRPGSTFFLPETNGVEINESVFPKEDEIIIRKHYPNSFRETTLLQIIQRKNIECITVCGAMSHMCIDATVRAAFDYGIKVIVADDACATRDLVFRNTVIEASNVHASFMAALSMPYADVLTTEEILKNLKNE